VLLGVVVAVVVVRLGDDTGDGGREGESNNSLHFH
jgi:hypothetical protein